MLHSVTHVYKAVLVGHRIVLSSMPVRPAASRHDREVMGDNNHSSAQIEPLGVIPMILAEILDHPPEPCATVV